MRNRERKKERNIKYIPLDRYEMKRKLKSFFKTLTTPLPFSAIRIECIGMTVC